MTATDTAYIRSLERPKRLTRELATVDWADLTSTRHVRWLVLDALSAIADDADAAHKRGLLVPEARRLAKALDDAHYSLRERLAGSLLPEIVDGTGTLYADCHECGECLDGTPRFVEERTDVDRYRDRPCPGCTTEHADEDGPYYRGDQVEIECAECGGECERERTYVVRGTVDSMGVRDDDAHLCSDRCLIAWDEHGDEHAGLPAVGGAQ